MAMCAVFIGSVLLLAVVHAALDTQQDKIGLSGGLSLSNEIELFKGELLRQNDETAQLNAKLREQNHRQVVLEGELELLKRVTKVPVPSQKTLAPIAFEVANVVGDWQAAGPDQLVEFQQHITNIGDHYNTVSNMFICPDDGIYYFYVLGFVQSNTMCDIALLVNDIVHTYVRADGALGRGSMAFGSVVQCTTGSGIWVERFGSEGGTSVDLQARFSGFKIG